MYYMPYINKYISTCVYVYVCSTWVCTVLVGATIAMMKHQYQKQVREEKSLFSLYFHIIVPE